MFRMMSGGSAGLSTMIALPGPRRDDFRRPWRWSAPKPSTLARAPGPADFDAIEARSGRHRGAGRHPHVGEQHPGIGLVDAQLPLHRRGRQPISWPTIRRPRVSELSVSMRCTE